MYEFSTRLGLGHSQEARKSSHTPLPELMSSPIPHLRNRPVRESMIALLELQESRVKTRQLVSKVLALSNDLPNGRRSLGRLDRRMDRITEAIKDEVKFLGDSIELPEYLRHLETPYDIIGVTSQVMEVFGGPESMIKILKLARYDTDASAEIFSGITLIMSMAETINEIYLDQHNFLMRVLETDKAGYYRGEGYTIDVEDTVSQGMKYSMPPRYYPGDLVAISLWQKMHEEILVTRGKIAKL